MQIGTRVCLLVVGLINFLPVLGLASAQQLESAYGVVLASEELQILMRHRALLFGVLGGFVLVSVFKPVYQTAAMLMAGISMIGFAALVLSASGYNTEIAKVLSVDFVGIGFLALALVLRSRAASQ